MLIAQAHSTAQQARLAITLAWIAGYTNILTVITCATVTSHMSGTVSQWGHDIAEGRWGLLAFSTFLLVAFVLGAALSALCTETGRRRGWQSIYVLPIAIEAALLAAFAIGVELHEHATIESGPRLYALTGLASMAMGLQNATITRISGGVVRTTHMTGVLTDLGLDSVHFLYWLRDRRTSAAASKQPIAQSIHAHASTKRLILLLSVLGSFALGAGLGTLAYGLIPNWAMFPPVLFLVWIIVQDIRAPICEIEAANLEEAWEGLSLPSSVALFHLRRDKERAGVLHRLPDLLAWYEQLPPEKRIVILDLGDAADLGANAAFELRALIRQSVSQHRHLVLSGISAKQYRTLRESGAADVLDPSNACPDLELAIARALTLAMDAAVPA
jgi:uncharacterized membrane protein YoaK (UPF0700 family)